MVGNASAGTEQATLLSELPDSTLLQTSVKDDLVLPGCMLSVRMMFMAFVMPGRAQACQSLAHTLLGLSSGPKPKSQACQTLPFYDLFSPMLHSSPWASKSQLQA